MGCRTCFNLPLAGDLTDRFEDCSIDIGTFHDIARFLDGMPPLDILDDADGPWWEKVAFGHLHSDSHRVTERFDTIIVDEAQDLSLAWLTMPSQLLDPAGPRRKSLLADESRAHPVPDRVDPATTPRRIAIPGGRS